MFKHFSRFSLLALGTVCLSGCFLFQDMYGPNSNPTGYSHYDEEYRTRIPDAPFFIEEHYTKREAARSEKFWIAAVNSLLNTMEEQAIITDPNIALQPGAPDNSMNIRFDYYLRQALKERGYLLVTHDAPISVPIIKYKAYLPGEPSLVPLSGYKTKDFVPAQLHKNDPELYGYNALDKDTTMMYMGLGIFDPAAPAKQQLLHYTEVKKPVLTKDLWKIKGGDLSPDPVLGSNKHYKEGANLKP